MDQSTRELKNTYHRYCTDVNLMAWFFFPSHFMMIQYSFPNTATMYPRPDRPMLKKNHIRLSMIETLLTVMQFIHDLSLKKSSHMHKLQPYI